MEFAVLLGQNVGVCIPAIIVSYSYLGNVNYRAFFPRYPLRESISNTAITNAIPAATAKNLESVNIAKRDDPPSLTPFIEEEPSPGRKNSRKIRPLKNKNRTPNPSKNGILVLYNGFIKPIFAPNP